MPQCRFHIAAFTFLSALNASRIAANTAGWSGFENTYKTMGKEIEAANQDLVRMLVVLVPVCVHACMCLE